MLPETDLALVVRRCRELPPAEGVYLEDDFVTNLLATVVDFQDEHDSRGPGHRALRS